MTGDPHTETIITYEDGGQTYEIDHLGIGRPETQRGNFAVYRDGDMVAEFCLPWFGLKREFQPDNLPSDEELIRHAKGAVAGDYASDDEIAQDKALQAVIGRHLPSKN